MTNDFTSCVARVRQFIADTAGAFPNAIGVPSREQDQRFNTLAVELFALQFTHNLAYRRLCEACRVTPAAVEHWSRIPTVPTAAFKELELTCLDPSERTTVFHSSGTTQQQPSRHFHGTQSLALYEASLWPWFERHVLAGSPDACCRMLILTPPPAMAPHSSLVHMFETVRRRCSEPADDFLGALDQSGAWSLDVDRAVQLLDHAAVRGKPVVLLGTAFNFVHLLDLMVERKYRLTLPADSRVMETGGYKGRSRELPKRELHALIADRLGLTARNIVCEYGMSELSSQAYIGGAAGSYQFPPWCRVRILSPETGHEVHDGETGLVAVYDLANAFSVMGVQTEDLAIRRGNGFELLGRAAMAEPRGCSLMPA